MELVPSHNLCITNIAIIFDFKDPLGRTSLMISLPGISTSQLEWFTVGSLIVGWVDQLQLNLKLNNGVKYLLHNWGPNNISLLGFYDDTAATTAPPPDRTTVARAAPGGRPHLVPPTRVPMSSCDPNGTGISGGPLSSLPTQGPTGNTSSPSPAGIVAGVIHPRQHPSSFSLNALRVTGSPATRASSSNPSAPSRHHAPATANTPRPTGLDTRRIHVREWQVFLPLPYLPPLDNSVTEQPGGKKRRPEDGPVGVEERPAKKRIGNEGVPQPPTNPSHPSLSHSCGNGIDPPQPSSSRDPGNGGGSSQLLSYNPHGTKGKESTGT
ncbi:hypothetical protein BDP27DRAFT_1370180 [Rhodocollybia butyracea]|uniref:Nucleoplasmin-like domain-containing protein n=1 Tax=Rhodocollybia butyracea TaxID=206335 RepID=A0A9P5PCK8_9AGAR|nr:hypothetical protein BDP27DRAFT_1370180 [Rhodocollybia butyracea]